MSAGATVWLIYAPAASLPASGVNETQQFLQPWEQNESREKPLLSSTINGPIMQQQIKSITTFQIKSPCLFLFNEQKLAEFFNDILTHCIIKQNNFVYFNWGTMLLIERGRHNFKFCGRFWYFLPKLCSINHPTLSVKGLLLSISRCSLIQPRLTLGAADSRGFPHWGCANLCSLTPVMSWHAQFTPLYYRRQVTPGCRSGSLSILDKNLYFCTAVEFRHTLLVIQGNNTGWNTQPPFTSVYLVGLWRK